MSEMIKTSDKLCKTCKYSMSIKSIYVACDYLYKTGNLRNCPIGYCDKYEKGKRPRIKPMVIN